MGGCGEGRGAERQGESKVTGVELRKRKLREKRTNFVRCHLPERPVIHLFEGQR